VAVNLAAIVAAGSPQADLYPPAYYAAHYAWRHEYEAIAHWIWNNLRPRRVVDFGCGNAFILQTLRRLSPWIEVTGVDGSEAALAVAEPEIRPFLRLGDLTRRLELGIGLADLVISTEVAEHLPPGAAETFVGTICRHSGDTVLFTAAPPGQSDPRHVNMQPPGYWRELFAAQGFEPRPELVQSYQRELDGEIRVARWLWTNMQIFRRR
jgi:SAM-dependent methyltransferase